MTLFALKALRIDRAAMVAALLLALPLGGTRRRPLLDIAGNWTGTGSVIKNDGTSEGLRCKAKYSLTPSGTIVHQELRCAADSYRMDLIADLVNQDGTLGGTWKEADRQVSGSVSGRIDGDVISTKIKGTAFEAVVVITTRGDKQTISLNSDSGNYAKAVTIALKAD